MNTNANFLDLKSSFPDLISQRNFIGSGGSSLVIADDFDAPSPVAIKFFYRAGDNAIIDLKAQAENEVLALLLLGGLDMDGVKIPDILDLPKPLSHPLFEQYIVMKRVKGYPISLDEDKLCADEKHPDIVNHFKKAGRLCAKFHKVARQYVHENDGLARTTWGDKIHTNERLNEETNAQLSQANALLQSHKISGVIHGDFHEGNILADPKTSEFTGLIDLGRCAWTDNIFIEFAEINYRYLDDFIKGYEAETGQEIPKFIMTLVTLAGLTSSLIDFQTDPNAPSDGEKGILREIIENLKILKTQFTTPTSP